MVGRAGWIVCGATLLAGGLGGCAGSPIVRAPINAKAPCADAQFLYTDWVGKGHGNAAFYRCGSPSASLPDANLAAAGRSVVTVTRRQ